jgi:hypothetical protein
VWAGPKKKAWRRGKDPLAATGRERVWGDRYFPPFLAHLLRMTAAASNPSDVKAIVPGSETGLPGSALVLVS